MDEEDKIIEREKEELSQMVRNWMGSPVLYNHMLSRLQRLRFLLEQNPMRKDGEEKSINT